MKYKTYKRAALVLVGFKNTIGSELYGNHLAVVLTKKDSPNNGVLTVIPFTSKQKGYYLKLGKIVSNVIIPKIYEQQNILNEKMIISKTNPVCNYIDVENHSVTDGLNTIELNHEFLNREELPSIANEYEKDVIQLNKVFDIYKNMDKISYAMVQNIDTISKLKVMKPINKYDPLNNIKLPDKLMNEIDKEIIRLFTKN